MANGLTHAIVGGATGFGVAVCDKTGDGDPAVNPLAAIAVGTVFGKLPDLLEPAINPHHRHFCHRRTVLLALGYGLKRAYD